MDDYLGGDDIFDDSGSEGEETPRALPELPRALQLTILAIVRRRVARERAASILGARWRARSDMIDLIVRGAQRFRLGIFDDTIILQRVANLIGRHRPRAVAVANERLWGWPGGDPFAW